MEHIHSIIIIKKNNKYLNYYDDRWRTYLFPNIKGNNINKIKDIYKTSNIKFLFDKIHTKYSISHKENRLYHHYFYEVDTNIEGEYFTLDELLENNDIKKNNIDIINYIKDYYSRS